MLMSTVLPAREAGSSRFMVEADVGRRRVTVDALDMVDLLVGSLHQVRSSPSWKGKKNYSGCYDEVDGGLIEVVYDGAVPAPDPEMDLRAASLLPVDRVSSPPPPRAQGASRKKAGEAQTGQEPPGQVTRRILRPAVVPSTFFHGSFQPIQFDFENLSGAVITEG